MTIEPFCMVEKLVIRRRYIDPARAWLLSLSSLASRQVNMADSEFSFIRKTSLQVQDLCKGGEFSK